MSILKHSTIDLTKGSCGDVYPKKRSQTPQKKSMMACAELINLDRSCALAFADKCIIGRQWYEIPMITQKDVKHVKSMLIIFIGRLNHCIQPYHHNHSIVGPINPSSSRGHQFILAATDYFIKWEEAIPLAKVKTPNLVDSLQKNIVYCF